MRKYCFFPVMLALLVALSVGVFAETCLDDYAYIDDTGALQHDFASYYHALAVDMVNHSGVSVDTEKYWSYSPIDFSKVYDYDAFSADYDSALKTLKKDVPTYVEPVDTVSPASVLVTDDSIATDDLPADVAEDAPSYVVYDMRALPDGGSTSTDDSDGASTGLRGFVETIFGPYTPVTTSVAVTETVDGSTITNLIDAVASGAAGVDYAWLAGVAIFCIVLFSFFRILGVVFKR